MAAPKGSMPAPLVANVKSQERKKKEVPNSRIRRICNVNNWKAYMGLCVLAIIIVLSVSFGALFQHAKDVHDAVQVTTTVYPLAGCTVLHRDLGDNFGRGPADVRVYGTSYYTSSALTPSAGPFTNTSTSTVAATVTVVSGVAFSTGSTVTVQNATVAAFDNSTAPATLTSTDIIGDSTSISHIKSTRTETTTPTDTVVMFTTVPMSSPSASLGNQTWSSTATASGNYTAQAQFSTSTETLTSTETASSSEISSAAGKCTTVPAQENKSVHTVVDTRTSTQFVTVQGLTSSSSTCTSATVYITITATVIPVQKIPPPVESASSSSDSVTSSGGVTSSGSVSSTPRPNVTVTVGIITTKTVRPSLTSLTSISSVNYSQTVESPQVSVETVTRTTVSTTTIVVGSGSSASTQASTITNTEVQVVTVTIGIASSETDSSTKSSESASLSTSVHSVESPSFSVGTNTQTSGITTTTAIGTGGSTSTKEITLTQSGLQTTMVTEGVEVTVTVTPTESTSSSSSVLSSETPGASIVTSANTFFITTTTLLGAGSSASTQVLTSTKTEVQTVTVSFSVSSSESTTTSTQTVFQTLSIPVTTVIVTSDEPSSTTVPSGLTTEGDSTLTTTSVSVSTVTVYARGSSTSSGYSDVSGALPITASLSRPLYYPPFNVTTTTVMGTASGTGGFTGPRPVVTAGAAKTRSFSGVEVAAMMAVGWFAML